MCTPEDRWMERGWFFQRHSLLDKGFSHSIQEHQGVWVCAPEKHAPLGLMVLLPLGDKWFVLISISLVMLDIQIQSGPKLKRIQFRPCTSLCPGEGWAGVKLGADRRGTRRPAVGYSSWNCRALVHMGTLSKGMCLGKKHHSRNHRSNKGTPCRMLFAALHQHTSEVQELNATNQGEGRMSRRLPLKPDNFPRSAGGINVCHFPLLTQTPCEFSRERTVLLYQLHWLLLPLLHIYRGVSQ